MKLPVEFPALDSVRRKMGAPLSQWTLSWIPRSRPTVENKPLMGEAPLHQIRPLGGNGPLVHQGRQILLYIKDTRLDRHTLLHDPIHSRRFHIAECRTLEQMRRDNRFARYVWTNQTTGIFSVEATNPNTRAVEKIDAQLYVCKNCLDALHMTTERRKWPEFPIVDFFRDYETFFHSIPQHSDVSSPPGGYPRNWNRIHKLYKESRDWTCEDCGVILIEGRHRGLLHCHHRNGVTADNRQENLQALCVECHNEQPAHGRFPPSGEERATLARLRVEQGI